MFTSNFVGRVFAVDMSCDQFHFQYQVILTSLLLLPMYLNVPKLIGMKVIEKTEVMRMVKTLKKMA